MINSVVPCFHGDKCSWPACNPRCVGRPGRSTEKAVAPDLLSIARRWAALDGGVWNVQRYAIEKAELLADTKAAIAEAEGHS